MKTYNFRVDFSPSSISQYNCLIDADIPGISDYIRQENCSSEEEDDGFVKKDHEYEKFKAAKTDDENGELSEDIDTKEVDVEVQEVKESTVERNNSNSAGTSINIEDPSGEIDAQNHEVVKGDTTQS